MQSHPIDGLISRTQPAAANLPALTFPKRSPFSIEASPHAPFPAGTLPAAAGWRQGVDHSRHGIPNRHPRISLNPPSEAAPRSLVARLTGPARGDRSSSSRPHTSSASFRHYVIRPHREEMGVAGGVRICRAVHGRRGGHVACAPGFLLQLCPVPRKRFVTLTYGFLTNLFVLFVVEGCPTIRMLWVGGRSSSGSAASTSFGVGFLVFMTDIYPSARAAAVRR